MASILESLGEEDSSFDVDQFIDMISAYVPGFSDIGRSASGKICNVKYIPSTTNDYKTAFMSINIEYVNKILFTQVMHYMAKLRPWPI